MKLEVGMYVRTEYGLIEKLTEIFEFSGNEYYLNFCNAAVKVDKENDVAGNKGKIIKASHNIIDLIKKDDILLGKDGKIYQCWKVYKEYVFTYSKNKLGQTITLVDYQIDRVLTKEQFEQRSYEIGEER